MGRRKTTFKVYGKEAHYWRPEMKTLLFALLCVELALEQSTEARNIHQRIIEAWQRPGCKELLKSNIEIPKDEIIAWFNSAAKSTVFETELDVWTDLYTKYSKSDDLNYLFNLISEFIKVGFNRKEDIKNDDYKVIARTSICLCFAVGIHTSGSYMENDPELAKLAEIKLGDKVLDLYPLEGVSDQRLHRKYTKAFKIFGFTVHHDKKLNDIAKYWYRSRVAYSGPEEFCREYQQEKFGIELIPSNVTKDIKPCDIAMGYPRKYLENPYT